MRLPRKIISGSPVGHRLYISGEAPDAAPVSVPDSTSADTQGLALDAIAVAVCGEGDAIGLVAHASELAEALGLPWEAIYVETPGFDRDAPAQAHIGEALRRAATGGAGVSTIAAASLLDGLIAHLAHSPVRHLVIGDSPRGAASYFRGRSMIDQLLERCPLVAIHVYPQTHETGKISNAPPPSLIDRPGLRSYLISVGAVAATLLFAELLQLIVPTRSLDLLFLFPVIAVAARWGLLPAGLGAILSVFSYNFFLLAPSLEFDIRAPQNLVMAAVLIGVAAYTSVVTARLRERLVLSDRSARDSASIATLAQRLTRDADWESTASTISEHVTRLFNIHAALFREVDGHLVVVGPPPTEIEIGALDWAAMEWSWMSGEEAGVGTRASAAANWQFQPLVTSLGNLAVLGLARDDGRDPVRPEQKVLLSTILSQASLALERLRLQDQSS